MFAVFRVRAVWVPACELHTCDVRRHVRGKSSLIVLKLGCWLQNQILFSQIRATSKQFSSRAGPPRSSCSALSVYGVALPQAAHCDFPGCSRRAGCSRRHFGIMFVCPASQDVLQIVVRSFEHCVWAFANAFFVHVVFGGTWPFWSTTNETGSHKVKESSLQMQSV